LTTSLRPLPNLQDHVFGRIYTRSPWDGPSGQVRINLSGDLAKSLFNPQITQIISFFGSAQYGVIV
ncbi:hypothetical protein, partial [Candidatus Thiosymbion oneisti]|uniref:hypothetical protein n=1 Tax=Candidatus Thiosymbion oneisti TaxID=589554 RepID=UPI001C406221